jgi:hypothetical protein
LSQADAKHRRFVQREIAELPEGLEIVRAFRLTYAPFFTEREGPSYSAAEGQRRAIQGPSEHGDGDVDVDFDVNKDADLTRALPPAAHALLDRYTDPHRRADVERQLRDTLTPRGAMFDRHERVRALDGAHLEGACTHVLRKQLRKPDTAIRHVLLFLRDTLLERRAAATRHDQSSSPRELDAAVVREVEEAIEAQFRGSPDTPALIRTKRAALEEALRVRAHSPLRASHA